MTRIGAVALCAALVLSIALAPAAQAEQAKPLAVLSLCSHQSTVGESTCLGTLAAAPDMPAWLAAAARLYTEGRGLYGVDGSRPWGVVLQVQGSLQGYCFVPVTSAQALSQELSQFIAETNQVGDNLFEIVGNQPNQKFYVAVTDRWLFASDRREALANLPADPMPLLGGLEKQYDLALRVNAAAVPYMEREDLNEKLAGPLRTLVTQLGSDRTPGALGGILEQLDSVTLGWSAHRK